MTTTVTKSIGTGVGRDYSTIQAWADACPSSLTSVDQIWKGECYNDSELAAVNFNGITTDSTRYPWLTAAAGQSFIDHATASTNAVKYDATKGVGLSLLGTYTLNILSSNIDYFRVDRLQFYRSTSVSDRGGIKFLNNASFKQCILHFHNTGGASTGMTIGNSCSLVNSAILVTGNGGTPEAVRPVYSSGAEIINCTIFRPTDLTTLGSGIAGSSGYVSNLVVKNTAVLGAFSTHFSSATIYNAALTCNNATNASSAPGTATSQTSVVVANQLVGVTSSAVDMRPKSGGNLAGNGAYSPFEAPADMFGVTRAVPPCIGAVELIAAPSLKLFRRPMLTGLGAGGRFFQNPLG